jgi:hypothetical protein
MIASPFLMRPVRPLGKALGDYVGAPRIPRVERERRLARARKLLNGNYLHEAEGK